MTVKVLCYLGLRSMEGEGDIGDRPGFREGALWRDNEDEDEFVVEMFCLKSLMV